MSARLLASLAVLLVLVVLLGARPAAAQGLEAPVAVAADCPTGVEPETDLDGDCVDDDLERSGYDRNLAACTPSETAPGCFVTDPTAWSSDGDPYSDFQEATNVNMDNNVEAPFNSPLVAAEPRIEVELLRYRFTTRGVITDARGRSVSRSSTHGFSTSTTEGVSVTTGAEASLTDVSVSTEVTASVSVTNSYSSSQTSGESLDWETATTTETDNAATLALDLIARNVGSATALNVTPTFNLFLGDEPLGTITPDQPFPYNLVPGDEPSENEFITVDRRQKGNTNEEITLSIAQLRRLQRGAPLRVVVLGLDAEISRWRPQDSNWSCGSDRRPCLWEEFQDQISARTLRLLVDFGYTGDPEAVVPRRHVGNPFDYRVYTGSPSARPGFTLREVLSFIDYDVEPQGDDLLIEGRAYPEAWHFTSGPERGGRNRDSTFFDYWQAAGEPEDVLRMVMPRSVSLLMASPDPVDPGPVVSGELLTESGRGVVVTAGPKGSIPVAGGEAHLFLNGREVVVPLEPAGNGLLATPDSLPLPVGAASSFLVVRDVLGHERTIGPGLTPATPVAATCAGVPPAYYREPRFDDEAEGTRDGVVTLYVDSNPDRPATAFCLNDGSGTDFWYPQTNDMGAADLLGVAVLDRERRVAVGEGAVLTSHDGGQSWQRVALADSNTVTFRAVAFREGTETGVTVGDGGVFLRTTDGGRTWTRAEVAGTGDYYDVDHAGADVWYAVGQNRVRRSIDDGRTWQTASVLVVDERGDEVDRPDFANLSTVQFVSATEGAIGDGDMADGRGRIYATRNGGLTWRYTANINDVADFAPTGDGAWLLVGARWISRMEDIHTPTFPNDIVHTLPASRSFVAVDFATPEIGYAVDRAGPVWRTADGGRTWATLYGGYPTPTHPGTNFMTGLDMLDADIGAVTGTDGVIGATDSGGGVPAFRVDVEEGDPPGVPARAAVVLEANYPNPFARATTLAFRLEAPQHVRLDVFDLLGRRVTTVLDAPRAAGHHEVSFDAGALAGGVYLYRLTTDSGTASRRMVVVR